MSSIVTDLSSNTTLPPGTELVGEVAQIAGESWYTTAGLMYVMEYFHLVSGLEWYQAIAAATVVMRTLTLPFTVMQMRNTARMQLARPEMERLQERAKQTQAQNDPEAAQIVMEADCEVTMVGLDVTHRTWATREDMGEVAKAAPKLGGFLRDIADFYIDFYVQVRGEQGCFLHDPLAVICATNPELFGYEEAGIAMMLDGEEAGRSKIDAGHRAQKIATSVQADAVKAQFMSGLKTLS